MPACGVPWGDSSTRCRVVRRRLCRARAPGGQVWQTTQNAVPTLRAASGNQAVRCVQPHLTARTRRKELAPLPRLPAPPLILPKNSDISHNPHKTRSSNAHWGANTCSSTCAGIFSLKSQPRFSKSPCPPACSSSPR